MATSLEISGRPDESDAGSEPHPVEEAVLAVEVGGSRSPAPGSYGQPAHDAEDSGADGDQSEHDDQQLEDAGTASRLSGHHDDD